MRYDWYRSYVLSARGWQMKSGRGTQLKILHAHSRHYAHPPLEQETTLTDSDHICYQTTIKFYRYMYSKLNVIGVIYTRNALFSDRVTTIVTHNNLPSYCLVGGLIPEVNSIYIYTFLSKSIHIHVQCKLAP